MSVSNNNNSNRGNISSYKMAHVAAFEINLIYAACYLPCIRVCACVCVLCFLCFPIAVAPLSLSCSHPLSPFADKGCLLRSGNEFPTNNENENKTLQCSLKSVDFSQRANAQMCESVCVCPCTTCCTPVPGDILRLYLLRALLEAYHWLLSLESCWKICSENFQVELMGNAGRRLQGRNGINM